jgi:hypothetical protein
MLMLISTNKLTIYVVSVVRVAATPSPNEAVMYIILYEYIHFKGVRMIIMSWCVYGVYEKLGNGYFVAF